MWCQPGSGQDEEHYCCRISLFLPGNTTERDLERKFGVWTLAGAGLDREEISGDGSETMDNVLTEKTQRRRRRK